MIKKFFRSALITPWSILFQAVRKDVGLSLDPISIVQRRLNARAAEKSALFIESSMKSAQIFQHREELWKVALDERAFGIEGLVLEFGVWKGESLSYFANRLESPVFGFDTFTGLEEVWAGTSAGKGTFSLASLPKVPRNAHLVVGRVQEKLPGFLENHPGPVSVAHFDLDTYQSTLDTLRILRQRLVPGSTLIFDELTGYPMWEEGEAKAWAEFALEAKVSFEYFATTGVQAGVRITPSK